MSNRSKIYIPSNNVIERTAGEMACVFYEAARSSGMKSKYKTPRAFARANLEKFIPKAVGILTSMLGRQDLPDLMKQEIYDSLLERVNEPSNITSQDVKDKTLDEIIKALPPAPPSQALKMVRDEPINIKSSTALTQNPFKKMN